jgi:hypothetical protein
MQYFGPPTMLSNSPATRLGLAYGNGLINAGSTNAKIARFALIPSASDECAFRLGATKLHLLGQLIAKPLASDAKPQLTQIPVQ